MKAAAWEGGFSGGQRNGGERDSLTRKRKSGLQFRDGDRQVCRGFLVADTCGRSQLGLQQLKRLQGGFQLGVRFSLIFFDGRFLDARRWTAGFTVTVPG